MTGQRPYAVKADSLEGIVRAVCESAPDLPSTVVGRRGDASTMRPALPGELRGDLDTIVLKALRKEPTRRYAPVAGSVRGHAPSPRGPARPGARGHARLSRGEVRRAGTSGAVAAAVLLAASLVGGIVATARQARIAEHNRQRAERRFEDVRKLANSFLFEFHDAIKDLPGATPAREIVVRRGLEYLDGLAAEAHGNPSLQLELATAYEKVGDVQGLLGTANLGQSAAAHRSYAKSVELREDVAAAGPVPLEAQRHLAIARKKLATMRMAEGDWAGTTGLFEQVRTFQVALAAQRPDDFPAQVDAAGSQVNVGMAWGMSGRRDEGLQACEEGLAAVRKLSASAPSDTQLKGRLGVAWIWVGNIAAAIPSKRERSAEAFREAAALYASLAAAEPDNAFWRLKLGDSHIGASIALAQLARWDDALASAHKAEEIYSALESADPKSDHYRQERAASQELRAKALLGRGDLAPAEPLLLSAERVMLEQYASEPENVLLRERLAGVQADRGEYHELMAARSVGAARTRHLQLALDWSRKAESHFAELIAQNRLPMGSTEELEKLRARIAQCDAALGTLAVRRPYAP